MCGILSLTALDTYRLESICQMGKYRGRRKLSGSIGIMKRRPFSFRMRSTTCWLLPLILCLTLRCGRRATRGVACRDPLVEEICPSLMVPTMTTIRC